MNKNICVSLDVDNQDSYGDGQFFQHYLCASLYDAKDNFIAILWTSENYCDYQNPLTKEMHKEAAAKVIELAEILDCERGLTDKAKELIESELEDEINSGEVVMGEIEGFPKEN